MVNSVCYSTFHPSWKTLMVVMFPFAYSCDDFPPDAEMLEEAALGVGKAMRTRHGEGYQAGQACDLTYRSVFLNTRFGSRLISIERQETPSISHMA
jgi:extracellular matrix protein 14